MICQSGQDLRCRASVGALNVIWRRRLHGLGGKDRHLVGGVGHRSGRKNQGRDHQARKARIHRTHMVAAIAQANPISVVGDSNQFRILNRIRRSGRFKSNSTGSIGVNAIDRTGGSATKPQDKLVFQAGEHKGVARHMPKGFGQIISR